MTIFSVCGNEIFIDQSYFSSLTIDDLNADQHLDVLIVYYSTSYTGLWLGDVRGNLTNEKIYALPENSYHYKSFIGDFNGDKRRSVLVLCYQKSRLMILLGFANEPCESEIVYSIHSNLTSVFLTNFNQDGRCDLFVELNNSAEAMKICMNDDGGAQVSSKLSTTGSASQSVSPSQQLMLMAIFALICLLCI